MRSLVIAIAMLTTVALLAGAPISYACEGNRVLLQYNFRSPGQMWPTSPDNFHVVRDGKLLISPALNQSYLTSIDAGSHSLIDMDACVDVAIARGGPQLVHTYGGLAFWARTIEEFYEIVIGPSGTFSVDRRLPNRRLAIIPFTASTAVRSGLNQVNRLRVTTRGNRATLYVNGVLVANITGQPPARGGYIGLTAQSGPNTRDVYEFTNFMVTN